MAGIEKINTALGKNPADMDNEEKRVVSLFISIYGDYEWSIQADVDFAIEKIEHLYSKSFLFEIGDPGTWGTIDFRNSN